MYIIADTITGSDIDALVTRSLKGTDNLAIIEIELSDISGGKIKPDPKIGIAQALKYAESGLPTILIGDREYEEINGWNDLLSKKNVRFLKKSLLKTTFAQAVRKVVHNE